MIWCQTKWNTDVLCFAIIWLCLNFWLSLLQSLSKLTRLRCFYSEVVAFSRHFISNVEEVLIFIKEWGIISTVGNQVTLLRWNSLLRNRKLENVILVFIELLWMPTLSHESQNWSTDFRIGNGLRIEDRVFNRFIKNLSHLLTVMILRELRISKN